MQGTLKKASFKFCTPPSGSCTPPSPAGSRRLARNAASAGFTLLEMLVVIVVMATLMGVTFRMMRPSERARALASTIKTLNLTHAALAEYQAEYGIYPPVVDPIQYNNVHGGLNVKNDPDNNNDTGKGCGYVPGVACGYLAPSHLSRKYLKEIMPRNYDLGREFCFGLASYLIDRRDPAMVGKKGTGYGHGSTLGFLEYIFSDAGDSELKKFFGSGSWWYDRGKGYSRKYKPGISELYDQLEPSAKDLAFYKRIQAITSKIISSKGVMQEKESPKDYYYYTIRDSYGADGHDLIYICPPPFTSYALFSAGSDGKVDENDPLNPDAQCKSCGGYHNKDNVYSSVNMK